MNKSFLIVILILTSKLGFSQDWNLFVFDQNSYYKQQYDNSANVENFLLDSILYSGDVEISYFNSKSIFKPACYKNIKQLIFDWYKNPDKIDSLIKVNDSIVFIYNFHSNTDTFIFKPNAKLNESWITNDITIRCSALGVLNILGHQDSIKTFTCAGNGFDGIEFILSKNHGLIKFLPLNSFFRNPSTTAFPPYFELIGYSTFNTTKGYTQPDFSEYFHLSPGDMLYWKAFSDPFDPSQPGYTRYHVDSITAAYISSDSVHYEYKRTHYNQNGSVSHVGNSSTYHLRIDEGNIVQNNTSWFGLKYERYQASVIFILESLYFKIENNDTITFARYQTPGVTIDTSNCMADLIHDYDFTAVFSTREGRIFHGSYSWGEYSTTLIGSIINGNEYGDTNIPTSIDDIIIENIKVYPNPFSDYITIDSPNSLISHIEIYNALGNMIVRQENSNDKIGLGELSPGLYILVITDSNNRKRQMKIIKQ